jgi:hypothetical protein
MESSQNQWIKKTLVEKRRTVGFAGVLTQNRPKERGRGNFATFLTQKEPYILPVALPKT